MEPASITITPIFKRAEAIQPISFPAASIKARKATALAASKRKRKLAVLIFAALIGIWAAGPFLVKESDPKLHTLIDKTQYNGRAYTGLAYELWGSWRPYKLMFFFNGRKFGIERHWYRNGNLWFEREYARGLPHGEWRQWFADGKIKSLVHYKEGQAEGEIWAWYENGQLAEYSVVHDGQDVTHKSWIPDGTLFANYVYQDGERVGIQGGDFCKVKKKQLLSSP